MCEKCSPCCHGNDRISSKESKRNCFHRKSANCSQKDKNGCEARNNISYFKNKSCCYYEKEQSVDDDEYCHQENNLIVHSNVENHEQKNKQYVDEEHDVCEEGAGFMPETTSLDEEVSSPNITCLAPPIDLGVSV